MVDQLHLVHLFFLNFGGLVILVVLGDLAFFIVFLFILHDFLIFNDYFLINIINCNYCLYILNSNIFDIKVSAFFFFKFERLDNDATFRGSLIFLIVFGKTIIHLRVDRFNDHALLLIFSDSIGLFLFLFVSPYLLCLVQLCICNLLRRGLNLLILYCHFSEIILFLFLLLCFLYPLNGNRLDFLLNCDETVALSVSVESPSKARFFYPFNMVFLKGRDTLLNLDRMYLFVNEVLLHIFGLDLVHRVDGTACAERRLVLL